MAYEGELVKLSDGRWARYRRAEVTDAAGYASTVLVAVEVSAEHQRMLDEAHGELWDHRRAPAPVRMSLDTDESGNYSLQLIESAAMQ